MQFTVLERLPQGGHELATKDLAEDLLGQEVVFSGTHPTGVIGREAAGRHDTMDMGMTLEFLIPGSKISYVGWGA